MIIIKIIIIYEWANSREDPPEIQNCENDAEKFIKTTSGVCIDITDSPCDQINITVSGYNGLNGEDIRYTCKVS